MLGMVLYEAVEIGMNVIRMSYNGGRGIYYWWYGIDTPEVEREKRTIQDIEILNKRLEHLEELLEKRPIQE